MKTYLLLTAAAVLLTPLAPAADPAPAPKNAKNKKASKTPADGHSALYDWLMTNHDTDKDGKLSPLERSAVKQAFAQNDFMAGKLDFNANGTLEDSEISRVANEASEAAKDPATKEKGIKKASKKGK